MLRPAEKGGHQQGQKCYMASGKGRTPAVTDLGNKLIEMLYGQRKRADTSSDTNHQKKFNTLHRRGFGMEDFPKRFKISIRDLKCKKSKNVLNENLSNNQLKKSRNISKNLEGIKGKIILTTQKISKNLEISRKISKHEKICKKYANT